MADLTQKRNVTHVPTTEREGKHPPEYWEQPASQIKIISTEGPDNSDFEINPPKDATPEDA